MKCPCCGTDMQKIKDLEKITYIPSLIGGPHSVNFIGPRKS